jgi:hypothetical protein
MDNKSLIVTYTKQFMSVLVLLKFKSFNLEEIKQDQLFMSDDMNTIHSSTNDFKNFSDIG